MLKAHCLTERIYDIDLLSLDAESVAEVGHVYMYLVNERQTFYLLC